MVNDDEPVSRPEFATLERRVGRVEVQMGEHSKKLDTLITKTDAQTLILTRLEGAMKNPYVRAVSVGIGLLVLGWLAKHGIRVEIPQ